MLNIYKNSNKNNNNIISQSKIVLINITLISTIAEWENEYRGCASRSPARPRRVKPNSGELKLYVISPGWRVELLLSFQFSIRY